MEEGRSTAPGRSPRDAPSRWLPTVGVLLLLVSALLAGLGPTPFPSSASAPTATTPVAHAIAHPLLVPSVSRVASSGPTGTIGSLSLTLHNTMASATGPYQQSVVVNSSAYQNLINSNWSNAEFVYSANGTPVPAWIESNASNSSSHTLIWLNMSSIAAGAVANLTLYFFPKSSFNLSASGPLGESPRLSAKYGEFDDGSSVFNFYDDFTTSKLGSKWIVNGSWSYTGGSGISYTSVPGSGLSISSHENFSYPAVVDFDGDLYQTLFTYPYISEGFGTSYCTGCGHASSVGWVAPGNGQNGVAPDAALKSAGVAGKSVSSSQTYHIFTTELVSTTQAIYLANYSGSQTLTTDIPNSPMPVGLAMPARNAGTLTSTETTYWIRERSYVAQMPSVSIREVVGVNFNETGLPSGTRWWINVTGGSPVSSTLPSLNFTESPGSYSFLVGSADRTYASAGGRFVVGTTTAYESVTFTRVIFLATFVPSGLPSGTGFNLYVAGQPHRFGVSSNITFTDPNGSYAYNATPVATTYDSLSGILRISGAAAVVHLNFTEVTYEVSFQEFGLPAGTQWAVNVSGEGRIYSTMGGISLLEPNGSYGYTVWSQDSRYAAMGVPFTIDGASATLAVDFAPLTFAVQFTESGLPTGAEWTINVSGEGPISSTLASQSISLENGSYSFAVSRPDPTYALPAPGAFVVAGVALAESVSYSRVTFSALFTESGLPAGTNWTITVNGTTRAGTGTLQVDGLVNGSYLFNVGNVSGYDPSPSSGVIVVTGAAAAKSIVFAQPPAATSPSFFASSPGQLALVGIAVVIVASLLTFLTVRRRRAPPKAPEAVTTRPKPPPAAAPAAARPPPRPLPKPAMPPRPGARPGPPRPPVRRVAPPPRP